MATLYQTKITDSLCCLTLTLDLLFTFVQLSRVYARYNVIKRVCQHLCLDNPRYGGNRMVLLVCWDVLET